MQRNRIIIPFIYPAEYLPQAIASLYRWKNYAEQLELHHKVTILLDEQSNQLLLDACTHDNCKADESGITTLCGLPAQKVYGTPIDDCVREGSSWDRYAAIFAWALYEYDEPLICLTPLVALKEDAASVIALLDGEDFAVVPMDPIMMMDRPSDLGLQRIEVLPMTMIAVATVNHALREALVEDYRNFWHELATQSEDEHTAALRAWRAFTLAMHEADSTVIPTDSFVFFAP